MKQSSRHRKQIMYTVSATRMSPGFPATDPAEDEMTIDVWLDAIVAFQHLIFAPAVASG
jgi:hypothetical protein